VPSFTGSAGEPKIRTRLHQRVPTSRRYSRAYRTIAVPPRIWGYVIKGQVRVIYADHQEVLCAGDLYYLPPGHTAIVDEDYEAVEFSPPAVHEQVLDVIKRNAAMAPTATALSSLHSRLPPAR